MPAACRMSVLQVQLWALPAHGLLLWADPHVQHSGVLPHKVSLEAVLVQHPHPALELLLVNLGALSGFLPQKGNLFSAQVFKSVLVSLYQPVLLLALQTYCKCSMCGLYVNTVYLRD